MSAKQDEIHRGYIPGGGLGMFTNRDQGSIFGFGILNLYLSQLLYYFGLFNNCFIFSAVFFWSSFSSFDT